MHKTPENTALRERGVGDIGLCNSTKQAVVYCEKMRLRITNTFTEGATYFIEAQREDSSL